MAQTFLYINDGLGNTWQVGIADNGVLSTTVVAPQSVDPLIVNDNDAGLTSWQFVIDNNGFLNTTEVTYSSAYPTYVFLNAPTVNNFALGVTDQGLMFAAIGPLPPFTGLAHIDGIDFGLLLDASWEKCFTAINTDQIAFGSVIGSSSISSIY